MRFVLALVAIIAGTTIVSFSFCLPESAKAICRANGEGC
jgi:hypothetical protein